MKQIICITTALSLAALLAACSGDSATSTQPAAEAPQAAEAQTTANDLVDQGKTAGEEAVEAAKDKVEEIKDAAEDKMEEVKDAAEEKAEELGDKLNELGHPQ
ncbi:hypothetical protein ACVBEJ_00995 [Porticoccus sp. GXU_MW_L64]